MFSDGYQAPALHAAFLCMAKRWKVYYEHDSLQITSKNIIAVDKENILTQTQYGKF